MWITILNKELKRRLKISTLLYNKMTVIVLPLQKQNKRRVPVNGHCVS